MKKVFLTLIGTFLLIQSAFSQAPSSISYQAVLRNSSGTIMASANVNIRFTIHDLSAGGTTLYQETHALTTSAQGIAVAHIGEGTVVTGSFTGVDWGNGAKFLETEVDAGAGYTSLGTQQLVSVPYSLFAKGVQATSGGGSGLRGAASSGLWWGLYEGGTYRGYLGSYAGKNEDVDIGTGGSNTVGSTHLVIAAVPKLTVDSIGNVGVGTVYPKYRFQVDGVTGTFNDNGIRINNKSTSTGWSFYASSGGDMIIGKTSNLGSFNGTTGAYTSLSDVRLKTNVQPLESVLSRVLSLETKRYEFKFNNPNHVKSIGFIAQDLQQKFPEYVFENTTGEGNPLVENQLSVDYAGLSVIAIKAIQEQQVQIQMLIEKNKQLEAEIQALKTKEPVLTK